MPSHYHHGTGHYDPYAQHEAELAGWLPTDYAYPRRASARPQGSGTYHDPYTFGHASTYGQPARSRSPRRSHSHNHQHESSSHSTHRRRSSSIHRSASSRNPLPSLLQAQPTSLTYPAQYRTAKEAYRLDPEYRARERGHDNQRRNQKYSSDPEFRARTKENSRQRQKQKYDSDPEYRARKKEYNQRRWYGDEEYEKRKRGGWLT